MKELLTALLDGLAYGMVLFVISIGLTVTMGLMRVINLAHGGFAMIGGYVTAFVIGAGFNFAVGLLAGVSAAVVAGALVETTVLRPLYRKGELSHVLLTFGLLFVITAALTAVFGLNAKPIEIPAALKGLVSIGYRTYPVYRLALIGFGLLLAMALWLLLDRSQVGARLRASVENPRIARAMGVNVHLLFTCTFAFGCGLAALGAVLGAALLPLEPSYALHYLVLFFIVVAIGGMGSFKGSFVAALVVGVIDTLGKYFVPQVAPYLIFLVTIALLLWRPFGFASVVAVVPRSEPQLQTPQHRYPSLQRLGPLWICLPWIAVMVLFFVHAVQHDLWATVFIMALLTLSLDLALGHAGIITLGQAAFFGFGAYCAGLFCIHVNADPLLGLIVAAAATGLFGLLSGALILHTRGLTLLMLTLAISIVLYEIVNRAGSITGGDDGLQGMQIGPLLGLFQFDVYGKTAFLYSLVVLFVWFVISALINRSPFGRTLDGIRMNPARMRAIGTPVWRQLVIAYAISAAMAGTAGALSAQTTNFVALNSLSVMTSGVALIMLILGGQRSLYGFLVGAAAYVLIQDWAAAISPVYWMFFIGALLMATVLFLDGGLVGLMFLPTKLKWLRRGPLPDGAGAA